MSRKSLRDRAYYAVAARGHTTGYIWNAAVLMWLAGYRAAKRDMYKKKNDNKTARISDNESPVETVSRR